MIKYLNNNKGYQNFEELINEDYFVDKSNIIIKLNKLITRKRKYVCITRPRRFGKSSIVDLLCAYYSKWIDSKNIFDKLDISQDKTYKENLNNHNIINIDFSELPKSYNCKYIDYISMIERTIREDIKAVYQDIEIEENDNIPTILEKTNDKFIFIFDEWDFIFNREMFIEHHNEFLEFLRGLLKDKPYVSLCYMTGILPIKKHSSGSALNMFDEYTILNDGVFDEYFGFTEEEVKKLCNKQEKLSFEQISSWYNGYFTEEGYKVYNPRSVVKALEIGKCRSYWTNTGKMDEVLEYLKYNTLEVRDDVVKMVNGEEVDQIIRQEFRAGQQAPKTKEEIYSAMIVLGFLSYYDGIIKIPNKELMLEFEDALKDESFGYVSQIVNNSKTMLSATLGKDTDKMTKILHEIHNEEIPILKYSDENSLSYVVALSYLYARDLYRIEREEKSGKGYVDFSFHPRRNRDNPFILELKKDDTVDNAINQIKEKEYYTKFKKEYKDREILLVAICYNSKSKEHTCKIETI